ncbi:MAG: ABC transporter ATP-binding protein [Actinomycetota bacterium]|nr:ABC transporter ATP-binding protein [Actinomycetota bacterium]
MLRVEALEVRYGDTVALAGIDLAVADGEIVSVLGPSGSGKSTLLRAIAGLEPSATGRVSWDGDDLTGVPPHRRQLGLMFQDHTLFPHRDVLGNVAFGLRMRGLARAQTETRARELLTLVGLAGYERRRVTELSGGEQQRVALARALAPAPRLLMLDEPLGSLDRALRERLMVELRELFTRLGLTSLYVTHDHDEAFALADRVVVMRDGRVEQLGAPVDVWKHPATEFVARFLGYNVTDALGGGRIGVRPDGVRIATDGSVTGVVTARTFRRDHFLLEVKVADGPPLEVAATGARVPAVGDAVRLAVDPEAVVPLPE